MIKRTIYLIFIFAVCEPAAVHAQGSIADVTVSGYVGGSFLPGKADHLSAGYYDDLRMGVNFGGQAILFIQNIGIGFCYDQSNFSASGEQVGSVTIAENYNFKFFGPMLASRLEINRSNQLVFALAFGKSIAQNDAVFNGNNIRFENDDFVPKLSVTYNYKFSDFAFIAGIQFVNEKEPTRQSILEIFGLGPPDYRYDSGTNFDRLSLNVGLTYHFSNLF